MTVVTIARIWDDAWGLKLGRGVPHRRVADAQTAAEVVERAVGHRPDWHPHPTIRDVYRCRVELSSERLVELVDAPVLFGEAA